MLKNLVVNCQLTVISRPLAEVLEARLAASGRHTKRFSRRLCRIMQKKPLTKTQNYILFNQETILLFVRPSFANLPVLNLAQKA